MSINVQNKKFLCLLRQLNIDIDQFPDKSFDGLFETIQHDVRYFLDWFMENINDNNALTENEIEIYNDMLRNDLLLTDDELNYALTKCSPKFDNLASLNENYINKALIDELNELNKELNQLYTINENLKLHHNDLKKNQINLKEESNKLKKELELVQKRELQTLNMHINSINMNLTFFNLNKYQNVINLNIFKDIINEKHDLVEDFKLNLDTQDIFSLSFFNNELTEFSELKEKYITSGCLSIISKGFLEEIKYKIIKAEEFLNLLKDEVENYTSFDEYLNVWCHADKLNSFDKLKSHVEMLEFNEIETNLTKDYDLELCNILNKQFQLSETHNIHQISKYEKLLSFLKNDLTINLMLSHLISKTIENESKCFELLDGLYSRLQQDQKKLNNNTDTIELKIEKFKHFHYQLNEKPPFAFLSNENPNLVNSKESQENLFSSEMMSDGIKFVFCDPNTFPDSFFNEMEEKVSSFMCDILCGPTNQIQIVPSELLTNFYNCGRVLLNFPHEVQKLLTEYVKFKDTISSSDRRKLLLWITFLKSTKTFADRKKHTTEL